jgi:diadenosine tetraphosphatase ApaH/serine/threonine PP2A family protein phosphatase
LKFAPSGDTALFSDKRLIQVRRALISDIHGNLGALDAVLDDIQAQGINEIYCLGDIIGNGPDPRKCVDRVMENCKMSLLGNHDQGASFESGARSSSEPDVFFITEWYEKPDHVAPDELRRDFLRKLPRSHRDGSYLYVHGSPRNPLSEYVFPEDIYNRRKMERLFPLFDRYCFHGHTHIPGIITDEFQFFSPKEIDFEYALGETKVLVDIGSVGQPRDGDDRACYVILEDGLGGEYPADGRDWAGAPRAPKITFRRVPYDFDTAVRRPRF